MLEFYMLQKTDLGELAQLVRASALHAEGHRFESCGAHWGDGLFNPFFRCPMDAWPSGLRHLPAKEESGKCRSAGSNPVASA